jgi:hypothetical protein
VFDPQLGEKEMIRYLAMWDQHGLEMLYNVTDWEKLHMWNILKGIPPPPCPDPRILIMRATANVQRKYEIYLFETEDLSTEVIEQSFRDSPQFIVDFIRENGYKLYSYPKDTQEVLIK